MTENALNNSMKNNQGQDDNRSRYVIDRQIFLQEAVIARTGYESRDKSVLHAVREYFAKLNFIIMITSLCPIIHWLPKYSIKENLVGDIISGITVAVMHIPQGMAYGILAGVTAEVGLYMAFFPVLIYMALGTSRHISMGTLAVVSMMTLQVVQKYSTTDQNNENETNTGYKEIDIVTATAIMVGILHLIMWSLQLGTLSSLLSEPLVNGFTTAAACHVVMSQVKDILGVSIERHKGSFKIVYTLINLYNSLNQTKIVSVIFSLGIIIFMISMNEFFKPLLAKKCRFPLPAELIAVVVGTLIGRYAHFDSKYNMAYVGFIPVGLPDAKLPPLELIPMVAIDSIPIAIVSYSVVMSMALTFADKYAYDISANQELFAMGISNIFGGFFSCMPITCSLSRSLIQAQTGGMTQIASAISALLILIVLLWIGPFFETLPKCVLAGIVIVALKGMFTQAIRLKRFWKQGKLEFLTWVCTFMGAVFIDIDYGLFLGICLSVATLYIKGWKSYSSLLGTLPETGIYLDLDNHKNVIEEPFIKIFRYVGPINFASKSAFKRNLYAAIEINQAKVKSGISDDGSEKFILNYHTLILDLSAVSHIDVAGCSTLSDILKELKILNVRMYLANPTDRVYDALVHSMTLNPQISFNILPTIHDAVLYARTNQSL